MGRSLVCVVLHLWDKITNTIEKKINLSDTQQNCQNETAMLHHLSSWIRAVYMHTCNVCICDCRYLFGLEMFIAPYVPTIRLIIMAVAS